MLQPDDTNNNSSNNNTFLTLPVPRRRLLRMTTVRVLVVLLFLLTALISSGSIRQLFFDYNGDGAVSPGDTMFIKTFCDNFYYDRHQQQHTPSTAEADQQPRVLVEHDWAKYIIEDHAIPDTTIPPTVWQDLPVKGVLYMVLQNDNIQAARATIRSIEDRFNRVHRYPWVLLSDQRLTNEFVGYVRKLSEAPMFFGKIDPEVWHYPSWVSGAHVESTMRLMASKGVANGDSLLYRQRARYHSGFFFHHPLMKDVEYAWRVEAGSYYSCDMEAMDLFLEMKERNKTIGFVMSNHEDPLSMHSLWSLTEIFIQENRHLILPRLGTIMPWLIDEQKEQEVHNRPREFNYCQIWSNFGIVKLDYLRSKGYTAFFEFLESTGGFFYERWSDSIVHTLGAALFLRQDQLHFFNRIGYSYASATHCPLSTTDNQRCGCDLTAITDFYPDSCTLSLLRLIDPVMAHEIEDYARLQQISIEWDTVVDASFLNLLDG